jgi:preprotein translocase subunit SecG
MIAVILVVHIFLAIALVAVILLQKSEGGALGIGGGGMSGFMTGRSTANLLTRTTAGIAVAFFLTSIALAMFASHGRVAHSVVEGPIPSLPARTAPAPAPAAPAKPAVPAAPSAPLAK